jgi:hypothetical protein
VSLFLAEVIWIYDTHVGVINWSFDEEISSIMKFSNHRDVVLVFFLIVLESVSATSDNA